MGLPKKKIWLDFNQEIKDVCCAQYKFKSMKIYFVYCTKYCNHFSALNKSSVLAQNVI